MLATLPPLPSLFSPGAFSEPVSLPGSPPGASVLRSVLSKAQDVDLLVLFLALASCVCVVCW